MSSERGYEAGTDRLRLLVLLSGVRPARIGRWKGRARNRIQEPPRREGSMADAPFDTIESAHDFVRLLWEEVLRAEGEILDDIALAGAADAARRLDALRLVHYKLTQLNDHLSASSRILNDLRALRRLLTAERSQPHRFATLPASDMNAPGLSAV